MTTKSTHVSEEKKAIVGELSALFKKYKTILIASIKTIPGSQFQEITKKLRGKTIVKVPKKNLVFKAIDSSKDNEIKKIEKKIDRDFALLFIRFTKRSFPKNSEKAAAASLDDSISRGNKS